MRDKPEISFLSSNNNFNKVNLEELTLKIGSGKTPKGGDANYQKSGIVLIRSQNIYNNKVNFKNIAYISPDVDATMINSRVLKGDVLLNITGASIGRSAVYKEEKIANVNQHVCIIRPTSKLDPYYLQLLLASEIGQKQISISQAGGGKEGLNFKQIAKMSFLIPSIEVQKKIGIFFTNFDETIALHQQELDALKQTKQGFLQKMFPSEGNVVPDTRFRNFNQDWKAYKLSDLGELFTGLSGLSKDDFSNGEHKYVTYMNVFSNTIININDLSAVDLTKKPKQNCLRKGDLLFTTSSETPQEVGMASYFGHNIDHVYLNSFCFGFRTNISKADGLFLAYFMRSNVVRNRLNKMAQGSTRYNLSKTEFRKMTINIPCLNEQIKIGEFFRQLDEVIDLKEQELESLKQTKQGFLQKMFV